MPCPLFEITLPRPLWFRCHCGRSVGLAFVAARTHVEIVVQPAVADAIAHDSFIPLVTMPLRWTCVSDLCGREAWPPMYTREGTGLPAARALSIGLGCRVYVLVRCSCFFS